MKWFFLENETIVKMALATLIALNFLPWFYAGLWVLFVAITFLLFRKNKAFYRDNFSINPDLLLSPVTGRVISVEQLEEQGEEKGGTYVRVTMPLLGPYGLFLPFDSAVEELDFSEGQSLLRWRKGVRFTNKLNRHNLILRSKTEERVELGLVKAALGFEPKLYVQPGDKGKALACFGYFPLGGSIFIKLPPQARVLVSPGDKLRAGETAIVGF